VTARALGLQAPRVYRNDKHAVNMEYVKNGVPAASHPDELVDYRGRYVGVIGERMDSDEGRMMGLLDHLISNQDRHKGNWMVTGGRHGGGGDEHIVPIDHGYAFGNAGPLSHPRAASYVNSPFAEHYARGTSAFGSPGRWKANDLTKGDVAEIRRRLEALRPDFEHLGRGDWHRYMLEKLDEIGKHASGTRSRLLPSQLHLST
jgi:hypothetical protein